MGMGERKNKYQASKGLETSYEQNPETNPSYFSSKQEGLKSKETGEGCGNRSR